MKNIIRVIVHLSPLIPLYSGRTYLAIALMLFVLLCYIKVFKLRQQLQDLAAKGGDPEQESSIQSALDRWLALTWMKAR